MTTMAKMRMTRMRNDDDDENNEDGVKTTKDEGADNINNNDDKNGSMVSAFNKMKIVEMLIVKTIEIKLLKMRA